MASNKKSCVSRMLRFFESGISPHQPSGSWLLKPLKHRLQNTSLQHHNGCRHRKAVRPAGRGFLFTMFCQLNYYLQACILSHPPPPSSLLLSSLSPFLRSSFRPSSKLCNPHRQTMHTSKTPPVQSNPLPFNEKCNESPSITNHHLKPIKERLIAREKEQNRSKKRKKLYTSQSNPQLQYHFYHTPISAAMHIPPLDLFPSNPIQFNSTLKFRVLVPSRTPRSSPRMSLSRHRRSILAIKQILEVRTWSTFVTTISLIEI